MRDPRNPRRPVTDRGAVALLSERGADDEEFVSLLDEHGVAYDARYLWD